MRIQSSTEASTWLKRRSASGRIHGALSHCSVVWPEHPETVKEFAARLAKLNGWSGGALVLDRPGMPREEALDDICELHRLYGRSTSHADIQLGSAPGHFFDEEPSVNQANLTRLLVNMMSGYLEGRLVSKGGRFVAVFGCGVVEFYCREKSMPGKLRILLDEMGLQSTCRASRYEQPGNYEFEWTAPRLRRGMRLPRDRGLRQILRCAATQLNWLDRNVPS